jgi:hypothetical protein
MKLKHLFKNENIEEDFIENHFEGDYWEKAKDFLDHNWERQVATLSEKQIEWAHKILEDCVEKRIDLQSSRR